MKSVSQLLRDRYTQDSIISAMKDLPPITLQDGRDTDPEQALYFSDGKDFRRTLC